MDTRTHTFVFKVKSNIESITTIFDCNKGQPGYSRTSASRFRSFIKKKKVIYAERIPEARAADVMDPC